MAKDPADRYTTCGEVAQDLQWIEQGRFDKVKASPPLLPGGRQHAKSRLPLTVIFGAIAILSVVFCTTIVLMNRGSGSADKTVHQTERIEEVLAGLPKGTSQDTLAVQFFSKNENGIRSFKVPPSKEYGMLGTFFYWDEKGCHSAELNPGGAELQFPSTAKLIFQPGGAIFAQEPKLLGRFHPDDVTGFLLSHNIGLSKSLDLSEEMGNVLNNVYPFDSIRLLEVDAEGLAPKSIGPLKGMLDLRWLNLGSSVNDGREIAEMSSLPHLRVLSVKHVDSHSHDLIKALGNNHELHKLSLMHCHLLLPDLQQIVRFNTVTDLGFERKHFPGGQQGA